MSVGLVVTESRSECRTRRAYNSQAIYDRSKLIHLPFRPVVQPATLWLPPGIIGDVVPQGFPKTLKALRKLPRKFTQLNPV